MQTFFTKGYQGESIDSFYKTLRDNKVEMIVDVRQNPFSFKKGFKKKEVELLSKSEGITYAHIKELGTPAPLRKLLRETGDYEEFFRSYEHILDEYSEVIEDLAVLAQKYTICILCFENDHRFCHRDIIAKKVSAISGKMLKVCHL